MSTDKILFWGNHAHVAHCLQGCTGVKCDCSCHWPDEQRAREWLNKRGLADLYLHWPQGKPIPRVDYPSSSPLPILQSLMAAFASSIQEEESERIKAWHESAETIGLGYDKERGFYNQRAESAEQQLAEARAQGMAQAEAIVQRVRGQQVYGLWQECADAISRAIDRAASALSAEAQPFDETLLRKAAQLLEEFYDMWEDGTPCYEDPEERGGYVGHAVDLGSKEDEIIAVLNKLFPRERPKRQAP